MLLLHQKEPKLDKFSVQNKIRNLINSFGTYGSFSSITPRCSSHKLQRYLIFTTQNASKLTQIPRLLLCYLTTSQRLKIPLKTQLK